MTFTGLHLDLVMFKPFFYCYDLTVALYIDKDVERLFGCFRVMAASLRYLGLLPMLHI